MFSHCVSPTSSPHRPPPQLWFSLPTTLIVSTSKFRKESCLGGHSLSAGAQREDGVFALIVNACVQPELGRRDREERKGHLAVSPDSDSFPAAAGADLCLPTWGCFLRPVRPQCLLASVDVSPARRSTNGDESGPVRSGLVAACRPLPIARKILHSQKKKEKKNCTHPVLIKSRSAEQSGGAYPVEAPHTSPGEQTARVGCHGVLYASCS